MKHVASAIGAFFVMLCLILIGIGVAYMCLKGLSYLHVCWQGAGIRSVTEPWSAGMAKVLYFLAGAFDIAYCSLFIVGVGYVIQICLDRIAWESYRARGGRPEFYLRWKINPKVYRRLAFEPRQQKTQP